MNALEMAIKALGADKRRPIVVGPWLSEVGFELLYWIPFLRWAIKAGELDPENLWIVSRGGCRSWYADITENYLELYDRHTPEALARTNRLRIKEQATAGRMQTGLRNGQVTAKQFYFSMTERHIMAPLLKDAGIEGATVLHPSLMYRAFRQPWKRREKHGLFKAWQSITQLKPIMAPAEHLQLPGRYVAVKFYASQANPDLPARRLLVQKIVRTIADVTDVVLLHTGTGYDEHGEFQMADHHRVHRVAFHPSRNLDEQTAIIGRAMAFVGTYGGFAYLAPLLGVPTKAFYGVTNFRKDHLRLMSQVAKEKLETSFEVANITLGYELLRRHRHEWMADAA